MSPFSKKNIIVWLETLLHSTLPSPNSAPSERSPNVRAPSPKLNTEPTGYLRSGSQTCYVISLLLPFPIVTSEGFAQIKPSPLLLNLAYYISRETYYQVYKTTYQLYLLFIIYTKIFLKICNKLRMTISEKQNYDSHVFN